MQPWLITESIASLEFSAYLDVSFPALSEDNFLPVTKKMGERLVIQGTPEGVFSLRED